MQLWIASTRTAASSAVELAGRRVRRESWHGGRSRWRAGGRARRCCAGRATNRASASGSRAGASTARLAPRGRPRVRGRRAAAASPGSPATAHTPARRSEPASVSSNERPSANSHRATPVLGFAGCLPGASSLSRPPCMRCTTKVSSPKSSSRCLPRRPTATRSCRARPDAGGTAVFSAVNVRGVNRSSVAAGVALVETFGVRLEFGQLGHGFSMRSLIAVRRARPRCR